MPERPSYTYTCRNTGCQGERQFQNAPPEWFQGKGLSIPTNCPSCRTWLDEQADEDATCTACTYRFRIPKGVKIMFHRNEGVWTLPVLCKRCQEDPQWARLAVHVGGRTGVQKSPNQRVFRQTNSETGPELIEKLKESLARNNKSSMRPTKVEMIMELRHYKGINSGRRADAESLYEHILAVEKVEWRPDLRIPREDRGGHRGGLARAFGVDVNNEGAVVDHLTAIAHNTNSDEVFQFKSRTIGRNGHVNESTIKIDQRTGVLLVINDSPRNFGRSQVIAPRTAFVPTASDHFSKPIERGDWTAE